MWSLVINIAFDDQKVFINDKVVQKFEQNKKRLAKRKRSRKATIIVQRILSGHPLTILKQVNETQHMKQWSNTLGIWRLRF